jgi:site-specific DNA-methyltransferase (adenine-specific)
MAEPSDLTDEELVAELDDLCGTVGLRTTLDKAIRFGELLMEYKRRLPHGEWEKWYSAKGLKKSTVCEYMDAARASVVNPSKVRATGDLTSFLRLVRHGRRQRRRQEKIDRVKADPSGDAVTGILTGEAQLWLEDRASESIEFVVTDPPYGLGFEYDGWTETGNPEEYGNWLAPIWENIRRVLKPGGMACVWQPYKHLRYVHRWFGDDIEISPLVFWTRGKRRWTPLVRWIKPAATPIASCGKGEWIEWHAGTNTYDPYQAVHPCPRSLKLCREVVRRFTTPGSLVVDPFCGVGTIPLAAHLEGRQWIGIDQCDAYTAIARNRIAKHQSGLGELPVAPTGATVPAEVVRQ